MLKKCFFVNFVVTEQTLKETYTLIQAESTKK